MRELLRSKARAEMLKAGYSHINREGRTIGGERIKSFFALHWREFV